MIKNHHKGTYNRTFPCPESNYTLLHKIAGASIIGEALDQWETSLDIPRPMRVDQSEMRWYSLVSRTQQRKWLPPAHRTSSSASDESIRGLEIFWQGEEYFTIEIFLFRKQISNYSIPYHEVFNWCYRNQYYNISCCLVLIYSSNHSSIITKYSNPITLNSSSYNDIMIELSV